MPYKLIDETSSNGDQESLGSTLLRGSARTGSRISEQIAGLPGDVFSLINEYIAKPVTEKITGKEGIPYEETLLGKVLPTTEKHREATKSAFGEYTEPQNKIERFIDDLIQDATAIAVPGAKVSKVGKKIGTSLAISIGANTAKELVQDLTADEKKGAYAKLGSLMMLSFFDKPSAAKSVGELYKTVENRLPSLKPVNATGLESRLVNLQKKLSKGTKAPSEKFVIDEAQDVLEKIKNGKITPEEAWASKRSLNEKLSKVLYDIPKKGDQIRAKSLANEISHSLQDVLKEIVPQDPKLYKDLKAADKAFSTIAKSNIISNFIENNLRASPASTALLHILGTGLPSKGIAPIAGVYEIGKALYRFSKSPVLAKHYVNIIAAAAQENAGVMNREIKKLDKEMQKQEKQQKKKFRLVQ